MSLLIISTEQWSTKIYKELKAVILMEKDLFLQHRKTSKAPQLEFSRRYESFTGNICLYGYFQESLIACVSKEILANLRKKSKRQHEIHIAEWSAEVFFETNDRGVHRKNAMET